MAAGARATGDMAGTHLLYELEPVVETNLDRHLASAREWFPHEYVPWTEGRTFDGPLCGQRWEPDQSRLSDTAQAALVLNLLTEDNLPSYHHEIALLFGRDGAWGTWVHRWTAEEGRHGTAIRDYLLVTRAVDPVALERARMAHMSTGYTAAYADPLRAVAYVSFQELATRISHRNTGRFSGDPLCEQLLARVAADENLHMVFYRNLVAAALQLAPDETMRAVADVVTSFQMPGHGIADFARTSARIAAAGIYDPRIHHDEVLLPVLRYWKVFELDGLTGAGERAREELATYLARLDRAATRFTDRRAAAAARPAEPRDGTLV